MQTDPAFQSAFKTATEAYRALLEPGNLAVAASIRDNPGSSAKDKVRAIECIRGPRPVPGVTVNVQQNDNGRPVLAGYVIDLTEPPERPAIDGKVVDTSPREGNAGEIAKDVAAERSEVLPFQRR